MTGHKVLLCLLTFISLPLMAMDSETIEKEVLKISKSNYLEVESSEFKSLDAGEESKGLYITLAAEKDSLWDNEIRVQSHIQRLQKTLNICGLQLKGYLVVNIKTNNDFELLLKSRSTQTPVIETKLFNESQQFNYPTVFLLSERKKYNTAKAYTDDFIDRMARINKNVSNLANTMWVSDNFESYKNTPNALPSYSVVAHEVAHILGVYGHVQTKRPNIMNSIDIKGTKNDQLNKSQCEEIADKMTRESIVKSSNKALLSADA